MVVYTSQTYIIVVSLPVNVIGVLNITLTEKQVIIIHFALQAMEQVNKRKPTFLTKKGISHEEIQELLVILGESGDTDDRILPMPPNAYII